MFFLNGTVILLEDRCVPGENLVCSSSFSSFSFCLSFKIHSSVLLFLCFRILCDRSFTQAQQELDSCFLAFVQVLAALIHLSPEVSTCDKNHNFGILVILMRKLLVLIVTHSEKLIPNSMNLKNVFSLLSRTIWSKFSIMTRSRWFLINNMHNYLVIQSLDGKHLNYFFLISAFKFQS